MQKGNGLPADTNREPTWKMTLWTKARARDTDKRTACLLKPAHLVGPELPTHFRPQSRSLVLRACNRRLRPAWPVVAEGCANFEHDIWTHVLVDGGAIAHVCPPWLLLGAPIRNLQRGSWPRQLCPVKWSTYARTLFLLSSGQMDAPRVSIRFAVADVRPLCLSRSDELSVESASAKRQMLERATAKEEFQSSASQNIHSKCSVPSEFRTLELMCNDKSFLLLAGIDPPADAFAGELAAAPASVTCDLSSQWCSACIEGRGHVDIHRRLGQET